MDFIEYEDHMVALNRDEYCRWKDIVFNHNKARYLGGVIPNAPPRRHAPIDFDDDGEPLWSDLDFFKDSEVLFETHPIYEAWPYSDFSHREDLDFSKRPVLVLMADKEWKAWRSSASVEAIDAHDQRNIKEWGIKHPERRWWGCEVGPAETCIFYNCVSCRNPKDESVLGHFEYHYTDKGKSD
jgi:hypothetical protein